MHVQKIGKILGHAHINRWERSECRLYIAPSIFSLSLFARTKSNMGRMHAPGLVIYIKSHIDQCFDVPMYHFV